MSAILRMLLVAMAMSCATWLTGDSAKRCVDLRELDVVIEGIPQLNIGIWGLGCATECPRIVGIEHNTKVPLDTRVGTNGGPCVVRILILGIHNEVTWGQRTLECD